MNKQCIGKLSIFFMGLTQKIQDSGEFFKKITVTFKSGTKKFNGTALLEDSKMQFNFCGTTETSEVHAFFEKLLVHAKNFDSVNVVYEERGSTVHIEADNKNVKMKTKDNEFDDLTSLPKSESSQIGNRDYFIKVGKADTLLKEIGILGSNGKVRNDMIRKYNQIDHFVELIDGMLRELTDKYDSLTILDCGCGKSYLTFVLNYYIKEVLKKPCYFIGLDYSDTVILTSRKMAQNLGYQNMEFKAMDIKNYAPEKDIHLIISLHACDTATDQAIALGINNRIPAMIIVPCCHKEILSQYSYPPFEHITKHGVLKARLADIVTDSSRSLYLEALGYKVSIVEYISPIETPKNLMIRAEKMNKPSDKLMEEYKKFTYMLNISPSLEKLTGTKLNLL